MARKLMDASVPLVERLFFEDGRLRGISMMNASKTRGTCLLVTAFNDEGKRVGTTTYLLNEKDFFEQWSRAVDHLAGLYDITNKKLIQRMLDSSDKFLSHYGLSLVKVVLEQFRVEMEPA